jgi:BMFP domain-containing protein YqiC
MSDKAKNIKTVKVKESDLVNLMDNIVKEAVAVEKKKIVAEQAAKAKAKNDLLESRIAKLEKAILSGKKAK